MHDVNFFERPGLHEHKPHHLLVYVVYVNESLRYVCHDLGERRDNFELFHNLASFGNLFALDLHNSVDGTCDQIAHTLELGLMVVDAKLLVFFQLGSIFIKSNGLLNESLVKIEGVNIALRHVIEFSIILCLLKVVKTVILKLDLRVQFFCESVIMIRQTLLVYHLFEQ